MALLPTKSEHPPYHGFDRWILQDGSTVDVRNEKLGHDTEGLFAAVSNGWPPKHYQLLATASDRELWAVNLPADVYRMFVVGEWPSETRVWTHRTRLDRERHADYLIRRFDMEKVPDA